MNFERFLRIAVASKQGVVEKGREFDDGCRQIWVVRPSLCPHHHNISTAVVFCLHRHIFHHPDGRDAFIERSNGGWQPDSGWGSYQARWRRSRLPPYRWRFSTNQTIALWSMVHYLTAHVQHLHTENGEVSVWRMMRACALGVVLWRRLPRLSCSYAGCCPRLLLLLPALVTRKWALRSLCAAQSRATREAAAV